MSAAGGGSGTPGGAAGTATGSIVVGRYVMEVGVPGGTLITVGSTTGTHPAPPADSKRGRRGDRAIGTTERSQALLDEATDRAEQGTSIFREIVEGRTDATAASATIDALLDLLARLDKSEEYADAIRVGRIASNLLALTARWSDLYDTLDRVLGEAERLGDTPAKAWAKHELGTLHLARGNHEQAARLLDEARRERVELDDREGLRSTTHNLMTLCRTLQQLVREGELIDRRRLLRGRRLVEMLVVAAILLAIGLGVGAALASSTQQLAVLTAAPTSLTFTAQVARAPAAARTLRIKNTGSGRAGLGAPSLSPRSGSGFAVRVIGCARGLAPEHSCALRVTYQGGRSGATLILPYTGGRGPLDIPLRVITPAPPPGHVTVTASASPVQAGRVLPPGACTGFPCAVAKGATVILTASQANTGYVFHDWTSARCTGPTSAPVCTLSNVTSSVAAVANYSPTTTESKFPVNWSTNPSGVGSVTASGAGCTADSCLVQSGGTVTLTASAPPKGHTFDWRGDCAPFGSNAVCPLSDITGPRTATANYAATAPTTFTVTWSASPMDDGTVTASGAGCTADSCLVQTAGSVTLTASAPLKGYTFDWSGDCAPSGSNTVCPLSDITGPRTATANYAATAPTTFTVTWSASPMDDGTVTASGTGCTAESCAVQSGGTVTLTATAPTPNTAFDHWGPPCAAATANVCMLPPVTGDESVTAYFRST